jgi:hypothetical protein
MALLLGLRSVKKSGLPPLFHRAEGETSHQLLLRQPTEHHDRSNREKRRG